MIEIRAASAQDAERLAVLRWEFRAAMSPPSEGRDAFVARCADWMRRELEEGRTWRAWVAVADGEIVGQAWLQTVGKLPNPADEREQHAYISNVFVQPAFRGGVGERLLDAALAFATAARCDRVVLWPSAKSVTLYERRGFVRNGDVMELSLGSTPR